MDDKTLVATFDSRDHALRARDALTAAGFAASGLSMHPDQAPAGGAAAGAAHPRSGVAGYFKSIFGLGHADPHVDLYSEAVRRGGYLLGVQVADEAQLRRAEDILHRHGSVDLDERALAWHREGWAGTEPAVIPVIQEALQVGTRVVLRGGVRVFVRVVETPVEQTISLREEHAHIEHHPVNRPATPADLAAAQAGPIEVRDMVEEPVVSKVARVVEEIDIGKVVTERTETVRDAVRHTDVRVEQLAPASKAPK